MKHLISHRFVAFSSLALALGVALLPATAQARGPEKALKRPHAGTYEKQVTKTPGHTTSTEKATRANGKTATRTIDSQRTDTGRTTHGETTGFNGKTATYDSTRTKTENGFTREVEATGPNGRTATKDITVTKEGNTTTRTVTRDVTPKPDSAPTPETATP